MASHRKPSERDAVLPKCPTGIHGLDEITEGGLPRGPPDPGLRRGRLRQDAARHGVPRPGHRRVRRARRLHGLRGDGRGAGRERRLPGLRRPSIAPDRAARDRLRPRRAERDRETGEYDLEGLFIRLGAAIDAHRRQAGRARHHRGALRRPAQRGDPAGRAAPAVPLAQGQRGHRGHHRRAGRRTPDPPRPGGVRQRLRHRPRPPGAQPGRHPPAADREVPRVQATGPTSTRP